VSAGRGTYAALLAVPGVRVVAGAALVARLQLGMMPLALILVTRAAGHSYGAAAAVVGVYMVTTALAAPRIARFADVHGQRPVLLRCAVGFPTAVAGICLLLALDGPFWLVLAVASLTGVLVPPISSCIRVLWKRLIPSDLIYSAFALEAVLQEVVFICGPLLVVFAVHGVSPTAAVAVAAATAGIGSAVFASTSASRAQPGRSVRTTFAGMGVRRGLVAVLLFDAAMAMVWGSSQVAMPAFADHVGSPAQGGLALTALSVGSLCGGLISGAARRADPRRRLLVSGLLVGVVLVPPLVASSQAVMIALMLVAGVPIAPAMASVYALVGRLAPPGRDIETYAWLTTATTAGIASGLFVTGAVIDHVGFRGGLWALLGTGLLCCVFACSTYRVSAAGATAASGAGRIQCYKTLS
jgi:predicted MFS family arabinose efflux permease